MKKKNGFISTSIIYSFFLIFVTLFLGLILNYTHNRILLNRVNEAAINDINKIKNARISNLNVGDYVLFELKEEEQDKMNQTSYILANIYEDGTYEFLSTTTTFNSMYNSNSEFITIDKFNSLRDTYKNTIKYSDVNTNMNINIVPASSLKRVRENITDSNIISDIYDTSTDYIVYNDIPATSSRENSYYNFRKYSITSNNTSDIFNGNNPDDLSNLLSSYCNLTYTNESLVYPSNNIFGYGNVLTATISTPRYINYCYYSNYENYNHLAKDGIVTKDESVASDLIPNDNPSLSEAEQKGLFYRASLKFNINDSRDNDYFISGKGTKEDPYILRTGGKE